MSSETRLLDDEFEFDGDTDDDGPDDDDGEGEAGDDSYEASDDDADADTAVNDQQRLLDDLLVSPAGGSTATSTGREDSLHRTWTTAVGDYGEPLRTGVVDNMKMDAGLSWTPSGGDDDSSQLHTATSSSIDSSAAPPAKASHAAGGPRPGVRDTPNSLGDLLRDWEAKAAIGDGSPPNAAGTGLAGVRAKRADSAAGLPGQGALPPTGDGAGARREAASAGLGGIASRMAALLSSSGGAGTGRAATPTSAGACPPVASGAAATGGTTAPPDTPASDDVRLPSVPARHYDALCAIATAAALAVPAATALAIRPVPANNIRYYLCKSAFPKFRGDTVRFPGVGEDVSQSPLLLTSRYNSPKLVYYKVHRAVRHSCLLGAMRRAGLKETKRAHWNIYWGKRLKDEEYLNLNPYQKVNHFPGTWHIGRKDMLVRGVLKAKRNFGDGFDIVPQTFLFPHDAPLLAAEMGRSAGQVYIVKPPASSCGRGIYLINSASDIPYNETCLVQRYIPNPLTIGGYKCDLRLYAAVTSFDPLRIYLFKDGLVRFATEKLKKGESHLSNRFMHLTNYSVNKKSEKYQRNAAAKEDDRGSKWSVQALKRYFVARGHDWDKIWWRIKDVVIKTFLTCESPVASKIGMYVKNRNSCFELYGFDILLTSNLNPYLLEVNIMPALSCSSPLDRQIKSAVVSNLLNLVGVQPYDRQLYTKSEELRKKARLLGFSSQTLIEPGKASLDGRSAQNNIPAQCLWTRKREAKEKDGPGGTTMPPRSADGPHRPPGRRGTTGGGANSGPVFPPVDFAELGPTELDIIRDTEDEYSRRGGFERIFPTRMTGMLYGDFFETRRYCNELLCQWEIDKARFSERNRSQLLFWLQGRCPYPAHLRNEGVAAGRSQSQPAPPVRRAGSVDGRERLATPAGGKRAASRERALPAASPPPSRKGLRGHVAADRGRPPSRPDSHSVPPTSHHRRSSSRRASRSRSTSRKALKATPPAVDTASAKSAMAATGEKSSDAMRSSPPYVAAEQSTPPGRVGKLGTAGPVEAEMLTRGVTFPKM